MPAIATDDIAARLRTLPGVALLLGARPAGPDAFLVGGAVRDALLGRPTVDLDVAVEGDGVRFAQELAAALGGVVAAHGRFGTARVEAPGVAVDVASTRRERYPHPGALPEVEPAPLGDDLMRRDFTINAIAVPLDDAALGDLRAPAGALDDLAAGRLRVLHAESFRDDPTRLVRLDRYAARLEMEPEPGTAALATGALAAGALSDAGPARVGDELRVSLAGPQAEQVLARMGASGTLLGIHPGLRHDPDLERAMLALLPGDARRDIALLAAAAVGAQPGELSAWLAAAMFPAQDAAAVAGAPSAAATAASLAAARTAAQIAAAAGGHGPEHIALAGALGAGAQARRWLDELRHVRLEIDGEDLLAAGVPEGPQVGTALRAALDAKLDGAAAGRDEELAAALAAVRRQ